MSLHLQPGPQPVSLSEKVFADALGLSNVAWLSYDYMQRDAAAT